MTKPDDTGPEVGSRSEDVQGALRQGRVCCWCTAFDPRPESAVWRAEAVTRGFSTALFKVS